MTTGEVDPATVATASWSTGLAQGQTLCLANVTLAPHTSWLAAVKMAIKNVSTVGFNSEGSFGFTGTLFGAGSTCSTAYGQDVSPSNPATATVTYSTK